jgi:predicted ATPase
MSHFLDGEILGLAGKSTPTLLVFDRHLNILYGLNGSGKTSLLKILHSAMTGDAQSLQTVPFTRATVRFHSPHYGTTHTRTIDKGALSATTTDTSSPTRRRGLFAYGTAQKRELTWTETIETGDDPRLPELAFLGVPPEGDSAKLRSFDHRYLPTARLHLNEPVEASPFTFGQRGIAYPGLATSAQLTEETLDQYFANALERLWESYTSEVGRSVRAAQAKGLANILKSVMSGSRSAPPKKPKLDLKQAYESVKQFLERQGSQDVLGTFEKFSTRYQIDQSLQAVVHDIYSVEQEVDMASEPQKKLERLIHRLYSGNKRIMFSDNSITVESGTGDRIGLESLSSGEKQLIRMSVECLSAGPNPILIDEPEISMHIDWQRELLAILQSLNPDAQFVVATHSPEIMAEIPDERLFSL